MLSLTSFSLLSPLENDTAWFYEGFIVQITGFISIYIMLFYCSVVKVSL